MSTTSEGQQATDSINGKLTFEQDKNRIVGRDENNIIRMLILANGTDFVMKVSEESYDVLTTTDDHIIFDSGNRLFKISKILTGSIAVTFGSNAAGGSDTSFTSNSTNSLVLPHGLTHIPAINVFQFDSTAYVPIVNGSWLNSIGFSSTNPIVAFQGTTIGGMATSYWTVSVDATNVTIAGMRSGFARAGVTVPGQTFPSAAVKVYCLQETAN